MTAEAHPLPFKHQDNTLSPSPLFLSRRGGVDGGRLVVVLSRNRKKQKQTFTGVFVFYAYSTSFFFFTPCTIGFFEGTIRGEKAVAFVGGRAPPTYSDWSTGLGVRGSRWELYFAEASPSPASSGGWDYSSRDAPRRRLGGHVAVTARGKGGD